MKTIESVTEFSYFSMECFSIIEVVTKSRDSLLITAPVLVPGEKDCDFIYGEEPLTEGQIRHIAHEYLANYSLVDKNHEFFETREVIGVPVESYITTEPISLKGLDGTVNEYPKGTWIATTRITDEEEMEKALNGEYTGYSITTVSKKFADKQIQLPRRVLMKDIKDPVGFTISLVRKPCVRGAKFCSMKEDIENGDVMSENIDDKLEEETKGFVQSIKGIFNKEDDKKDEDEEIEIDVKAIVDEVTKDFVNTDDFETFKKELEKELSEKFETLGTELFKAIRKSLEKEEDDEAKKKEDDENDEEDDEEEVEGNDDSQNVQSSKSIPNHDIKDNQKVAKTGAARVYEIMGRDNTGSAVRKL